MAGTTTVRRRRARIGGGKGRGHDAVLRGDRRGRGGRDGEAGGRGRGDRLLEVEIPVSELVSCAYAPIAARRVTRFVSLVNCMLAIEKGVGARSTRATSDEQEWVASAGARARRSHMTNEQAFCWVVSLAR